MRYLLAFLLLCALPPVAKSQEAERSIRDILFKISATVRRPDISEPWKKSAPQEISGTGFLIEGNRIMTNAHMVRYATQIYVQPEKSDQKYPVNAEYICQDADLAILKLEDESILKDRKPIPFDDALPVVRAEVTVHGYPLGGNQLSVTKGIISRTEFEISGLFTRALRTQIDAAINKGNSGGPVISNDKIVGVVYGGLDDADNIGYIVPTDEIRLFLKEIADGNIYQRPYLWVDGGTVENPALRKRLKLPDAVGGIRVSKVDSQDPAYPLHVDDVMIKIGPHAIDSHGDVSLPEGLTLNFRYYIPRLAQAGMLPMTIWRDAQEMEVSVPVSKLPTLRVLPMNDRYPSYAIIGPLAFETLGTEIAVRIAMTQELKQRFLFQGSPFLDYIRAAPAVEGEELVFIPASFPSRLMKGYSPPLLLTVASVNGVRIKNLRHLVEFLRDCKDEYLQFCFREHDSEDLTFNRQEFISSTEEILSDNNIRKQFSEDLRDLWKEE